MNSATKIRIRLLDTNEEMEFDSVKDAHIAVSTAFQRDVRPTRTKYAQVRCDVRDRSGRGIKWWGSHKLTGTATVGADERMIAMGVEP